MDTKQIRDFIKSHEKRYYTVTEQSGERRTYIKKAFKVTLNSQDCWINLDYNYPTILSQAKVKLLVKTMDEAKRQAELARERAKEKKRKDVEDFRKAMINATDFMDSLFWHQIRNMATSGDNAEKEFIKCLKRTYDALPNQAKDDDYDSYVDMLERYIMKGTFLSQTLMFTKEQVVKIENGRNDAIEITLADGTRFVPANKNLVKIIRLVFGVRGAWYRTNLDWPDGTRDKDTTDD